MCNYNSNSDYTVYTTNYRQIASSTIVAILGKKSQITSHVLSEYSNSERASLADLRLTIGF